MLHSRRWIAFLVLACAALPALACGTAATATPDDAPAQALNTQAPAAAEPTPMGGGGLVAFTSTRDGFPELYVVPPQIGEASRLTNSGPVAKYFPKWAPNGEFMLFWVYTANPPVSDEYWWKPDGTMGVFAEGVQPYVSFSPDSETVVLCALTDDGGLEIFTVPASGGDFTRLTNDPAKDFMPAWSPDGESIAFVSDREGPLHIYLMDPDGGNQRRLTDNDLLEAAPAWSPDGTQIAFFAGETADATNVYVVNADGTGTVNITNQESGFNEDPTWSPDGTMIGFWSDRTGDHEIFAMRLDGTGLVNLTNSPEADENPSWGR
jgi:TolB protein